MDPGKLVEDQFSNMHPSLPLSTRIGIVGAGPSGLSAAYALVKLGYTNVTVLEKYHTVGGMCESVEVEGRTYDLGGQVLAANSAPFIFHLAKEVGAELEEMDSHKLALIDSSTGKYQDLKVADDYVSVMSLTLKLQDEVKNSNKYGMYGMSELASDPAPVFLQRNGLKGVPKSVAYGYTASGYGFVQDMPYAYIHEFIRTSMAGKIRRFKGGYTSFWQKISQSLAIEVHCNTEVLSIRRNQLQVTVDAKNSMEKLKFLTTESKFLDMSELEKELFSKVNIIDYYTTVLKIKGLEYLPVGFYYFGEFMEDPTTIGHPVAMQKFYDDTDVFLFWSYGNSNDIREEAVAKLAIEVVKNMGAKVEKVVLQRRFKYFPHVNGQDMKDGFYEKVELELQGNQNTYYVGGLMAFELTERNSFYSMALVCKQFASGCSSPIFPYVKRMLPLIRSVKASTPRELLESPGLEFPDLSTIDRYLRHWGTHKITQGKTLYTWINEKEEAIGERTYMQLHTNASRIAHKLLTNRKPIIKPGDRVLLIHVPGLDFIDAFFGCLRARVIPVPVLPPDPLQRGGQALLKIENISSSCNAVAILSSVGYHAAVRAGAIRGMISLLRNNEKCSARWPNLPWLYTDSWVKGSKNTSHEDISSLSESQPGDLCFLQFTSGSTGDAKGVMITHGGLIHNVKLMRRRYRSNSKTVLVSWLPQYHDMGLIGGLFTAMVSGGSAVLFSPLTFIKNPLLWLQTLSKYQATHSAGPNFAFELLVRKLEYVNKENAPRYDLSSLVFLMVAAEPVRQKTLRSFIELTQPFGLTEEVMAPGYGLAENCVFVSCAFGERKPILIDWQGRVCCGYVNPNDPDVDIRIVDPETGEERDACGKEGEIWISSPSAGIGYWGKQELSRNTFKNELKSCPGKLFTRTGDLGRIIDQNLFITGRIKDLIIIAGRNIYSADVEKTVESTSELLRPGCCAIIGVPEEILSAKGITLPESSDQVGLVVIAEVREGKSVSKETVERIQNRVIEEHGVPVATVKLIKPRTISKTTSGKIKRFECLKQFIDGTLSLASEPNLGKKVLLRSFTTGTCTEGKTPRPHHVEKPLHPSPRISKRDIVEFLKRLVLEETGVAIERISTTESLVSYGIDSIGVVKAAQKLSSFLGVQIGAVDIFTASCIEDLASLSENLVMKSKPQPMTSLSHSLEVDSSYAREVPIISGLQLVYTLAFQLLAIIYGSALLILPIYLSVYFFLNLLSNNSTKVVGIPFLQYIISLVLAPFAWVTCIFLTCVSISLFGNSFLQPNYALTSEISLWSVDFVRWWILYKVQDVAGKLLAVHLRGTVFLKYWFKILGARIGSSVLLDTIDITDPSLVSIDDGAVIAEGALIQSHEVKNGILSFSPIRIGRNSCIGPYAVIQKGSTLDEEDSVQPLQKTEGRSTMFRTGKPFKDETPFGFSVVKHEILEVSSTAWVSIQLVFSAPFRPVSSMAFTSTYLNLLLCLSTLPFFACFALLVAFGYLAHGLILTLFTKTLLHFLNQEQKLLPKNLRMWFQHRLTTACHLRFARFLSGTEAFCMYLRFFGAKIGKHCSIRATNPLTNPELISMGQGVHLGDFCRILTGFYSSGGYNCKKVEMHDNAVIGSQSLVLSGSIIQEDVILGALSVAPADSVLQRGGVFVGSQNPIMVKNSLHSLDDRIEEMDMKYKKVVGNLAANLAVTTMKVKSRYFHRIGVSGKGVLKMFDDIKGLPDHKIFHAGKSFPIVIRHSNSLSADDDARIDARGAALRMLTEEGDKPLLDLTLKTGKAFYARTISDFATWLVCGLAAREAQVKRAPHIREAVWDSLRNADSYTNLHYYSNFCRLIRCEDGQEMYVKFKLRPLTKGLVKSRGRLSQLAFFPQKLVQFQPVPIDEAERDIVLDCTKPWNQTMFPFVDVGEITISETLTREESEALEFNPFLRCHEVDIIRATSSNQSASIDHGRSLIYEICQHLRNNEPLPQAWRVFLEQSDVKVDLTGCPMASPAPTKPVDDRVTLQRKGYVTLWAMIFQPLLQTVLPYFLLSLVLLPPLHWLLHMKEKATLQLHFMLPLFWACSGFLAALLCVAAKWVFVGKNREGESMHIWSRYAFSDTIWQALRSLVGEYCMEMVSGSLWFGVWMRLMGSEVEWESGVYVDTMNALLNPEMVQVERGGCVGRDALLFGHIYEGEGGRVKFGRIEVGESGFVGSRAVVMPGVRVESWGSLGALSIAMKEEIIK
ncbi:hypothetical protein Syun_002217 [Stephania yunnanensis]|uniref:Carrier domain-containing protein n=1 Tax=Stephania yunnanensis TaxID=152371 RepID=A0AAP0Q6Z9_9MAGN